MEVVSLLVKIMAARAYTTFTDVVVKHWPLNMTCCASRSRVRVPSQARQTDNGNGNGKGWSDIIPRNDDGYWRYALVTPGRLIQLKAPDARTAASSPVDCCIMVVMSVTSVTSVTVVTVGPSLRR